MSRSLLVALILISVVAFAPSVKAAPVDPFKLRAEIKTIKPKIPTIKEKPVVPPVPVIKEYVIADGDTLTKISQVHTLDWIRIWQKNLGLANPDQLNVGEKLVIPEPGEVLAERALPTPPVSQIPQSAAPGVVGIARAVIPGNSYSPGFCTFHVKNMRPDLPNFLGDAHAWLGSAQAQGLSTGSQPAVGAVAVTTAGSFGHVAYVIGVSGGSITISEMNYQGWNVVSTRTTSASEWDGFIY